MELESFVQGFGEFRKKQKLSTVDTSNFDENDKSTIAIAEGEAKQQINKLNAMRSNLTDEEYNLGVEKAKKPLREKESELISKYKPVPTSEPKPEKTFDEASVVDEVSGVVKSFNEVTDKVREGIVAPFKPQGELAVNFLAKMGNAIGGTAEDVWNWLARDDVSFYEKQREINRIEAEALNKTIDPQGKALVTPSEATTIVASLIPIGRAVETMAGVEAGIGYGEEFAKTGDIGEAATAGVVSGAIALAGGKLAEKFFPDTDVPTKFAKQMQRLSDDDAKALTKALDNIETKGLNDLSVDTRTKLLDDIMEGSEDTGSISKKVLNFFKNQKQADETIKNLAYDEANAIARETEPISMTQVVVDTLRRNKKTKYGNQAKDEIKKLLKGKSMNAEDMESTLSTLKGLQSSAKGEGRFLYGKAIEDVQAMQNKLGGEGIYAKARELDTAYNINYLGKREGRGMEAGKKVAGAIKSDYEEYIGAELLGSTIKPKLVGKAVKDLPEDVKMKVVQDVIKTGIDDIKTPEGISQVLDNFYKIDTKGLEKILGKEGANRLKLDMDSLDVVNEAIAVASKANTSIKQEVVDIVTAGLMFNISPFLAARSAGHGVKKIVTKKMLQKERGQLIARIQKIPNGEIKRSLTKAFAVMLSPKASEEYQRMLDKASEAGKEKKEEIAKKPKGFETTEQQVAVEDKPLAKSESEAFVKGFEEWKKSKSKPKEESKKELLINGKKPSKVEWGRGAGDYSDTQMKRSITGASSVYNKLSEREGYKEVVYKDSVGKPTAGIGHLLTDAEKRKYPVGTKIPKTQIDKWFEQDTRKARNAAKMQAKEIGEPKLEEALIHVNFQLGTNWKRKFNETYPLLKKGKYKEAINKLKKSKWMKQTPKRVNDFIQEIEKLT